MALPLIVPEYPMPEVPTTVYDPSGTKAPQVYGGIEGESALSPPVTPTQNYPGLASVAPDASRDSSVYSSPIPGIRFEKMAAPVNGDEDMSIPSTTTPGTTEIDGIDGAGSTGSTGGTPGSGGVYVPKPPSGYPAYPTPGSGSGATPTPGTPAVVKPIPIDGDGSTGIVPPKTPTGTGSTATPANTPGAGPLFPGTAATTDKATEGKVVAIAGINANMVFVLLAAGAALYFAIHEGRK